MPTPACPDDKGPKADDKGKKTGKDVQGVRLRGEGGSSPPSWVADPWAAGGGLALLVPGGWDGGLWALGAG